MREGGRARARAGAGISASRRQGAADLPQPPLWQRVAGLEGRGDNSDRKVGATSAIVAARGGTEGAEGRRGPGRVRGGSFPRGNDLVGEDRLRRGLRAR